MLGKNQGLTRPQMGHVQENKRWFKLAVRGDSGTGGLVAPLPCSAYFGKLAVLFGCFLPQQAYARPCPFVLVSHAQPSS